MTKIAILGGGNLGTAIADGLIKSKTYSPKQIYITRNRIERLQHLKNQGVRVTSDNNRAVKKSDIIILAVKPYKVQEVLDSVKGDIDPKKHLLISVATGITLKNLSDWSGQKDLPVFRAMPNTAIAIQESVTCLCQDNATDKQTELVTKIFNVLGQTIAIQEELMEAATVLGACGIAFVFRFIRAMIQGGIEIGFDAQTASAIANQTVKGAAELLIQKKQHPEEEIDKVTTPKGCTISGLNEMEHRGFSSSLIKGILNSFTKIEK